MRRALKAKKNHPHIIGNIGKADRMSGIKSAERVLALFEFFAGHQKAATIGEIANALDIPQSSTSVLIRNLIGLGYLEHDSETRGIIPTMRIALLGDWITRDIDAERPFLKLLDELRKQTGETVVLSRRNDVFAQYILVLDAINDLRLHVKSGMLRPLTRCSPGIIFLAALDDKEIGKLTRRLNSQLNDERLIVSETDVLADVNFYRKHGYAITKGYISEDISSVGVAISTPFGKQQHAVSIGGPSPRIHAQRDKLVDILRDFQAQLKGQQYAIDDMQDLLRDTSAQVQGLTKSFIS